MDDEDYQKTTRIMHEIYHIAFLHNIVLGHVEYG